MIGGIDNYLAIGSVKSSWVALYILSIIYGVLYVARPLFDNGSDISDIEGGDKRSGGMLSRVGRVYDSIRDNMLYLFFALTLNSFGSASTKAMSVLTWIYFVIAIINAVAIMFMDQKVIRAIFNLIFFVLILILTSLAFKHGW